ncbi:MAG: winged helix-turn-helix transcriptional regulator [Nocardioidaceae bacterium]
MSTSPTPTPAAPAALQWSADNCSIARSLEIVGERWTFLVLRELFQGVRRFDDLRVRTSISRQLLSERLRMLVERGLVRREPYREQGQRQRHEYRLTDKGLELYPILVALMTWGDAHLTGPEGPSMVMEHRGCGEAVHLEMRCAAGHVLTPREVGGRPGPGARRRAG